MNTPLASKSDQRVQKEIGLVDASHRKPALPEALLSFCLLAVGLLPFANICNLVWNGCSNALGNDFDLIIPRVEAILHGQPIWDTFNDAMLGSHSHFVPILLHAFAAAASSWDTRFELSIGIAITLLRSWLLFDCIAHSLKGPIKCAVFAFVMAFGFGTFNSTVFFFGLSSTVSSCVILALSIGIWGLARFKDTSVGIACMLVGGILSGCCSGEWLVTWIAFLISLVILKAKRTAYLVWFLGISISAAPYVLKALTGADLGTHRADAGAVPWSKVQFFLDVIGRAMANNSAVDCRPMKAAIRAGIVGVSMIPVLLGVAAYLRLRLGLLAISLPLISFGLLSAVQIGLFRQWVAPWYVSYTSPFWLGLAVLALSIVLANFRPDSKAPAAKWKAITGTAIGASALLVIVIFYLQSNVTYADKDYFRRSHGPSAESTMRNYRIAPTYAESCLFSGGLGTFGRLLNLCRTAEKHHWSAFSHHQNWSLQGDYVLPTVTVKQPRNDELISFVGAGGKPGRWSDPEHLDLSIPCGGLLSWSFSIPSDTKKANLCSEIMGAQGSIRVYDQSEEKVVLASIDHAASSKCEPVFIPLDRFRGKELTVVFSANEGSKSGFPATVFKHPIVDVVRTYNGEPPPDKECCPSNIETSSLFPKEAYSDVVLQTRDRASFKLDGLVSVKAISNSMEKYKLTESLQPKFTYTGPLNLTARDYSHLVVEVGASRNLEPRVICVQLTVNDKLKTLLLTMVPDPQVHKYSYDLKLLDLKARDKIVAVQLLPVYDLSWQQDSNVELTVGTVRFVRKEE